MPWLSDSAGSRKGRIGPLKSLIPISRWDISSRFFVVDIDTDTTYVIDATLQVVSPNAYWYVDAELDMRDQDLQRAASEYESNVRPVLLEAFGDVWNPGVDGDPRLTVLHTDLGGSVAGYFDVRHEFPRHTHPNSNEREMLFMDGVAFRPGSDEYMKVLAHELQHAIHWAHDQGEDSWVNEGLSEVATELVGYSPTFIDAFLRQDPQLNSTFGRSWEAVFPTMAPRRSSCSTCSNTMATRAVLGHSSPTLPMRSRALTPFSVRTQSHSTRCTPTG